MSYKILSDNYLSSYQQSTNRLLDKMEDLAVLQNWNYNQSLVGFDSLGIPHPKKPSYPFVLTGDTLSPWLGYFLTESYNNGVVPYNNPSAVPLTGYLTNLLPLALAETHFIPSRANESFYKAPSAYSVSAMIDVMDVVSRERGVNLSSYSRSD